MMEPPQPGQPLSAVAERGILKTMRRAIRAKRTLYGRVVSDSRSLFDAVDRDGNGAITLAELSEAFRRLDVDVAAADMRRVMASIDTDGGGGVDYRELRQWLIEPGDEESSKGGMYEGCTIRVDGLEGDLADHSALIEAFSSFGEIVACDVVPPNPGEEQAAWALVTFAARQAAELTSLFSSHLSPVESLPPETLASITTHLPGGRLQLEGLVKMLARNSWLHIRPLNRTKASHTEGLLASIVGKHEKQLQRDVKEKIQAEVHERHKDPTHVPAYNILRTGSRGGAKGTMLEHRPPYAAFPQEARERETRRLEQRIQERTETIKLLREWGQGTPAEIEKEVEAKQRANAADQLMIQKMAESAKGDEQAVWTMAMSKVRSMAREQRQSGCGGSEHTECKSVGVSIVADGGPSSVNSITSEYSLGRIQKQHEKVRRAKARKQKKAEIEAKQLAADMKLQIARGRTPSTKRTVRVSEEELQRQINAQEAQRRQKQRSSPVAATIEDRDEELRLPSLGPERVLPQVQDTWSARMPRARIANMPQPEADPLTPGTQKRLRFLDWQRAKQAKKTKALDAAGVSPRVVALHKQVVDAESALDAKDYVRAAAALHNAEVAVAIAPANAGAHLRRAESQRMMGDGHAVGALKSTDAALLIEPADARQIREFRKRLAEVQRDRTFRGGTPKNGPHIRRSYPTPAITTAVEPIPPRWPEPPRGPRLADTAPMASQRNHWDEIGLVDLMKPQDRLRAVILSALQPRSLGHVPGASLEEQENYKQILKPLDRRRVASFAMVEDDLNFLLASLQRAGVDEDDISKVRAWASSNNVADETSDGDKSLVCTDHAVGVLKACCPKPTHEDWKAVLQQLHSNAKLIRSLHSSLASRSVAGDKTAPATVDRDVWSAFVVESGALKHEAMLARAAMEFDERKKLQDERNEMERKKRAERRARKEEIETRLHEGPKSIDFSASQQILQKKQDEEERQEREQQKNVQRQQQKELRRRQKQEKEQRQSLLDQRHGAARIYLRAVQDTRDASSLLETLKDDYLLTAGRAPRTPGFASRSQSRAVAEITMEPGGSRLGLGCFCAALLRLARESFPSTKKQGLAQQIEALFKLVAEHKTLLSKHAASWTDSGNDTTVETDGRHSQSEGEITQRQHDLLTLDIQAFQQLPSTRTVFDKFNERLRRIFNAACAELPSAPLAAGATSVDGANPLQPGRWQQQQQHGLQLSGWLELARRLGMLVADPAATGQAETTITRALAESIFREESDQEGSSLLIRVLGFQGFEAALTRWAMLTDPLDRGFVDHPERAETQKHATGQDADADAATISVVPVSPVAVRVSLQQEEQQSNTDAELEPNLEPTIQALRQQRSDLDTEPGAVSVHDAAVLNTAAGDASRLDVESLSAWLELSLQQLLQEQVP